MAKDFRNVSSLPDDFLIFDFGESPHLYKDNEEAFGKEEADRLEELVYGSHFIVKSNMVHVRETIVEKAMEKLRESGTNLDGITVEAPGPSWISYCKNGKGFAWRSCNIDINEKYMEWDSEDGAYPLIPTKDQYEYLGCSWIENGDPSWTDYEIVEKAIAANNAA